MALSLASATPATPNPINALIQDLIQAIEAPLNTNDEALSIRIFETTLQQKLKGIGQAAMAQKLQDLDLELPNIEIDGVPHRCIEAYTINVFTAFGIVSLTRHLYTSGNLGEPARAPAELRAGLIEGMWTYNAAKQAFFANALLSCTDAEALFKRIGWNTPSRATFDRLPKRLSASWEAQRHTFETHLRDTEELPEEAVTIGVSLDGVMLPTEEGRRVKKARAKSAPDKQFSGPRGFQEVGVGTLSLYNAEGDRLKTVVLGRMPESNKASLKLSLEQEVASVLRQRPGLRVVKLSDGAPDHWTYLEGLVPGISLLDFWHAVDRLGEGLRAALGVKSSAYPRQFKRLRGVLREPGGAERVIRSLRHYARKFPGRAKLDTALKYFRTHRHRMRYAEAEAANLPIGSGVVEAGCKGLVVQRMRCSGMCWGERGGQAILTARSLVRSDRFDRAWAQLAKTYTACVTAPGNLVLMS